jgi:hypothetical protein
MTKFNFSTMFEYFNINKLKIKDKIIQKLSLY